MYLCSNKAFERLKSSIQIYKIIHIRLVLIILFLLGFQFNKSTIFAQRKNIDTVKVAPTQPRTIEDLDKKNPFDLRTPSNIQTRFVYDPISNLYFLTTNLDGKKLSTPIAFTPKEYMDYISRKQNIDYYLHRGEEAKSTKQKDTKKFNPFDLQFDIGAASKIFGPGGIRIRTQGSADLNFAYKYSSIENPSLSEKARRNGRFDFDEKIQASVQASVGDKLSFDMNYNTASTFEIDAKRLKLSFEGKEDDIIKLLEAGNVSISPRNSLINGGQSLFGIHSKLQFGSLTMDMIFSQQKSDSKRVSSKGGVQSRDFEIEASNYDELKHFFLSFYFRNKYGEAMRYLPYIQSPVRITRMEVWVSNLNAKFDDARNLIAFGDLGESENINNSNISRIGTKNIPYNEANNLYSTLNSISGLREADNVRSILPTYLSYGKDYEKIESARKLQENEYTYNASLGYISLNSKLRSNQVLAVAYEYILDGQTYRVGEFSSDKVDDSNKSLIVKLIKSTALQPKTPYWHLMMKNVYSLGAGVYNVSSERFRLDVLYRNDASGIASPYLPEGEKKDETLISLLGLDNIDIRNEANKDGVFDFVEGYTIDSKRGLIYFPTIEPFAKTIKDALGENTTLADKYSYDALYNSSIVEARQFAEKNKYLIRGSYKASNSGQISLGTINVDPGSVVVMAGATKLRENVDYTVDYLAGIVTIINEQIISSGQQIDVSLENSSFASTQRKSMMGIDLNYQFNRNFNIGATLMHLSELPLISRSSYGQESVQNTIWGANLQYHKSSKWLTNMLNYLPFMDLVQPSQMQINAEFAQLLPSHYRDRYNGGYSYIDDFESSQGEIDLMSTYYWALGSIPQNEANSGLFPESRLSNDISIGNKRALISWFSIDPIFNMENNSLTPTYIKANPDLVSNNFVRQINISELFPYKDLNINETTYLRTFSLSYYPRERGPYNLSRDIDSKGYLLSPQDSWASIMRPIDQSDFENSGIEYIEFWLMDPFVNNPNAKGGNLYINLGDISEDIIKDDKLFYENGLPINDDARSIQNNAWGKVPSRPALGYAFDNTIGARSKQDIGFDGLSDEEEKLSSVYSNYINDIKTKIDATTLSDWQKNILSPINDPSGDNFRHYRNEYYDNIEAPILERYKYYNGVENNSKETGENDNNSYQIASTLYPDIEDINKDNNLNTDERYYQYKVELRPSMLKVGQNFIVDKKTSTAQMRNGKKTTVDWYQFKIPIRSYTEAVNGIEGYRSIRFMRIFLHDFMEECQLRFATLRLIRGDWREYQRPLFTSNNTTSSNATLSISSVGLEENGDRVPINYVLPPGVSRILDGATTQAVQQNEQSLSLKVQNLASGNAKAVYKNISYDIRRYSTLNLFSHAERLASSPNVVKNGDLSLFIRFGADFQNNYYEYSIPLEISPEGRYNSDNERDREIVWPRSNQMKINLKALSKLKSKRNAASYASNNQNAYFTPFSEVDAENNLNTMTVLGNPSLSDIRSIMIGVRNNTTNTIDAEVWVDELRLGDYDEEKAWAANTDMSLSLSDLANISMRAKYISSGFGALAQSLNERTLDDNLEYSLTANTDLGKFLPKAAKIKIPVYYTMSRERQTPKYNPIETDILLSDALENSPKALADSIKAISISRRNSNGFSISNAKVDIRSEKPMPYDPANISISYAQQNREEFTPEIEYNNQNTWNMQVGYDYTPSFAPIRPLKSLKGSGDFIEFLKGYAITLWPTRLSLQSNIQRHYEEQQLRNFSDTGISNKLPVSFVQQFIWNRKIVFAWDITNRLRVSFDNTTNARIEEPYMQVNRRLNPDDYKVWQDSVWQSIKDFGTPMKYSQTASINYTLPTREISILNWLNAQASYTSSYNWDLGPRSNIPNIAVGNRISNQMNINATGQINIKTLFNNSKTISDIIRRVESNNNSKVRNKNKSKKQELESSIWQSLTDNLVYALLMLKDINFSYRIDNNTIVPSFIPNIGAFTGQGSHNGLSAPGFAFAFGLNDIDEVDRMAEKGWLINSKENISPATFASASSLDIRANIKPIKDLNISLTLSQSRVSRVDENFMFEGRPRTYGGNFLMTTMGLKSIFSIPKGEDGYKDQRFDNFLNSRATIREKQLNSIIGNTIDRINTNEPSPLLGRKIDKNNTRLGLNSPAVLIPAFLDNYTLMKSDTKAIPSLLSILPNWSISYSGLNNISWLKEYVKNINIRHAYSATYRIDNYNSFTSWTGKDPEGLGILPSIDDPDAKNYINASFAYDISSVSVQEAFSPLLGIDLTFDNGMSSNLSWRKTRSTVLNLSAFQLIESNSNELSVGLNYRVSDIMSLFKGKPNKKTRASRLKKEDSSPKSMTFRLNYAYRHSIALIRKIEDAYTQATQGNSTHRLSFSSDYEISKMLTLRAFYEWDQNNPLVSTSSFPMSNSNFGVSLRINLTQ